MAGFAPIITVDGEVVRGRLDKAGMAMGKCVQQGGVEIPVGLTVFKTAGGSLRAVLGGFDSHTPLYFL